MLVSYVVMHYKTMLKTCSQSFYYILLAAFQLLSKNALIQCTLVITQVDQ